MERYIVRKYAREYIVRFDHGERVQPGGFVFHAPSHCMTLAYKHKQELDRAARGVVSPRIPTGQKKLRQDSSVSGEALAKCISLVVKTR